MTDRKQFRDLVPPEEAHAAVASLDLDAGIESVPLADARGRVLAGRVDAGIDVPGFDRSGLDGYAVRAADTFGASETEPALLDLVGSVTAGEKPDTRVEAGETVEIATGAVMPPGADAMVMVERTDERSTDGNGGGDDGDDAGRQVAIRTAVTPGENVMPAGADIAAGERALGPGTRLTPREIGLLSALGHTEVPVRASPRVGIVSTGEELVRPGGELDSAAGQIYDVNTTSIAAGVAEAGGEPVLYPHVGDDYDAMENVLRKAATECDLVLSSGSTSAGAVDVIYRIVEELGELLVHGVAVKPGKPMLVGRLDEASGRVEAGGGAGDDGGVTGNSGEDPAGKGDTTGGSAYVGLPGYPVSALTIFRTFVAPAIREAAGLPDPATATREGRMAVRERYTEGRLRYVPVGVVADGAGELLVYPVDKGSGATTSLVEADGVVAMDPDTTVLDAGEAVSVELFSPDVRAPGLFGIGEDDPALARLLDRIERPRYLGLGSRAGLRRLREGVSDVAVTTLGPPNDDGTGASSDEVDDAEPEPTDLGGWTREWGLVVPAGNPEEVSGVVDLVERDLRFVNRPTESGLRTSLANALADLADERHTTRHDLVDAIEGFEFALRAYEGPARAVAAGRADAGLGLRVSAERLDLGFVPVGEETLRVLANPDRIDKPGVVRLVELLDDAQEADGGGVGELVVDLPGITPRDR